MPEIKEIQKFADFIKLKLKNENVLDIKILNGRYKKHGPFENYDKIKKSLPLKLLNIKTKGKLLYMIFQDDFYMFNALGLNGGWCYLKNGTNNYEFSENLDDYSLHFSDEKIKSYIKNALNHLNIEFKTKSGSLYYFDVLSFGSLKVIQGEDELNNKLNKIGPDIIDKNTNLELFKTQIKKKINLDKEIGIVLMNQKIISGIGNYLRADILYLSKINPFRKVNKLSDIEIEDIFNNCKILTLNDFKKLKKIIKLPLGNRLFLIYNQDKDIYGNIVVKKELYEGSQKRFIYYVPKIQK